MVDKSGAGAAGSGAEGGAGAGAGGDGAAGGGKGSDASATTQKAGADGSAGAGKSGDEGGAGKGIISDGADKGDGKGDEGGKGKEGDAGAPEKYEPFKLPEGLEVDEATNTKFVELAKESGLSQEKAQKFVDSYASMIQAQQKAQIDAIQKQNQEWYDKSIKMMGANAKTEMPMIAKARDAFFNKEAVAILRDSGLENHPAIVQAFIAIGKAIADDTVVDGGSGGGAGKTLAETIYPNQAKK